jgi:hypothetical protein
MTVVGATLAGCGNFDLGDMFSRKAKEPEEILIPVVDAPETVQTQELRPNARPSRDSAVLTAEPAPRQSGPLGVTVASLGNPAEPGLWLKTPLVKKGQTGRVIYNGQSIEVTLIPIPGEATAGSRMSLDAFKALGAPLTELAQLSVSI